MLKPPPDKRPLPDMMDAQLFAQRPKALTDLELHWDAKREILMIYGGIPQLSGVWAFALGGKSHQGRAWRVNNNGDWQLCYPEEMPCLPWLAEYETASHWLADLSPAIRSFWDQGVAASMVVNHLILHSSDDVINPGLIVEWCQHFMHQMNWHELKQAVSQGQVQLKRDLATGTVNAPEISYQERVEFYEQQQAIKQHKQQTQQQTQQQRNNVYPLGQPSLKTTSGIRSVTDTPNNSESRVLLFPKKCTRNRTAQLARGPKILLNPIPKTFKPPAFTLTNGITPVLTPEQLFFNAQYMGYPEQKYLYRIIDGFYFIYHLEYQNEQATLGLIKRNNRWYGDTLMGVEGVAVSDDLKYWITDWLSSQQTAFI